MPLDCFGDVGGSCTVVADVSWTHRKAKDEVHSIDGGSMTWQSQASTSAPSSPSRSPSSDCCREHATAQEHVVSIYKMWRVACHMAIGTVASLVCRTAHLVVGMACWSIAQSASTLWRLLVVHCVWRPLSLMFIIVLLCVRTVLDAIQCTLGSIVGVADRAASTMLRTQLSVGCLFWSLLDVRGMCLRRPSRKSFENIIAVVVGDLGDISVRVASEIAREGARAVHLVSSSDSKPSTFQLETLPPDTVIPHRVDFSNPAEVAQWCRATCQLLVRQENQISVLVLGSVAVGPKEQRFTRDALDQAFAADIVGLQTLLAGLRPALSPGARVVITASAACCWLSRISREALSAGNADVCWLDLLEARAQQQAARVVLATHQARKWAIECGGPVCVSCTPTGCWSAWTDVLAWAGLLETFKAHFGHIARGRLLVTKHLSDNVLHLCSEATTLVPGDYYWGRRWSSGSGADFGRATDDADICKMLVVLALRSGQLPG